MTHKWKRVSRDRYWEMLEILFPATMTSWGFLVGEPYDHNAEGYPRFDAFVEVNGRHYAHSEPMTVRDFKALTPSDMPGA